MSCLMYGIEELGRWCRGRKNRRRREEGGGDACRLHVLVATTSVCVPSPPCLARWPSPSLTPDRIASHRTMAASPALSPFVASPQHPAVSSPAGFGFHARQASLGAALTPAGFNNAPSPATIFLQHGSHTPGAGTGIARPPHLLGGTSGAAAPSRPAPSQAGSGMSSSFGVTAMDAPNEARRLIRLLVETEGQGRLSLVRIAREVEGLQREV